MKFLIVFILLGCMYVEDVNYIYYEEVLEYIQEFPKMKVNYNLYMEDGLLDTNEYWSLRLEYQERRKLEIKFKINNK